MTHHKCVPRTIGGKSFMMCVTCGMAFPDTVTASEVMASECVKVKRYDAPKHINAPCDSRDKWTYQGDILIDAWQAGRGKR